MKFKQILNEMPAESAKTSRKQVAAGLKKLVSLGWLNKGDINLDYGGGAWDDGTDYLAEHDIINYVYDPFNRDRKHNNAVIQEIKRNGGADSATLLNVLNVIPDKEERLNAFRDARSYLKPSGKMLIQCFKKSGSGEVERTKDGWQLNQPISFYKEEIEENFSVDVKKSGQFLIING